MASLWLSRGASTVPPLPKVRYWGRPAFHLLIGSLIGILIAHSGYFFGGLGVTSLLILTLYLLKCCGHLRGVSYILLWSILFALYAHYRAEPSRSIGEGVTLYETELLIGYPVANSHEGEVLYSASVEYEGRALDLRVHLPKGVALNPDEQYGTMWVATLDLSPLTAIRSGLFRDYLLSEGYEAEGYIQRFHSYKGKRWSGIGSFFRSLRSSVIRGFEQISEPYISVYARGLLYALVLGDRSYLDGAIKDSFTMSGVAHILAVSGYHLGVVYLLLFFFLRFLLPFYSQRGYLYLLLFLTMSAYALLCGASTATMRALFMTSLLLLGRWFGRRTDPVQVVSLTLFLFLFLEPYAYRSIGLLLSVAAVWGIYLFVPLFQCLCSPSHRLLKYLLNIVMVTVAAQLGVLPLLFHYFGLSTFSFIWSNIPLALVSSILIPFGLVALLIGSIVGWLPSFLLSLLGWLSETMISVTKFFSSLDMVWLRGVSVRYDLVLVVIHYIIVLYLYEFLYLYLLKRHFRANAVTGV